MTYFRAIAALFIGTLAVSGAANAATVNYTGTQYDIGTISAGQNGTVSTDPVSFGGSATSYDMLSGYLAPNTEIIFTYTPTKSLLSSDTELYAYGSYDYTNNKGKVKMGSSASTAVGFTSTTTNTVQSGLPLVIASANITDAHAAMTTITNNSPVAAYFLSVLESAKNFKNTVVTYVTVSTVPLPASLPLFVLALVALAGFGYQQKVRSRT